MKTQTGDIFQQVSAVLEAVEEFIPEVYSGACFYCNENVENKEKVFACRECRTPLDEEVDESDMSPEKAPKGCTDTCFFCEEVVGTERRILACGECTMSFEEWLALD